MERDFFLYQSYTFSICPLTKEFERWLYFSIWRRITINAINQLHEMVILLILYLGQKSYSIYSPLTIWNNDRILSHYMYIYTKTVRCIYKFFLLKKKYISNFNSNVRKKVFLGLNISRTVKHLVHSYLKGES